MTSEDSDQPAHLHSPIRVFADCICLINSLQAIPKRDKREPLPYWVDVLSDLSLCWSRRSYCRFCRGLAHTVRNRLSNALLQKKRGIHIIIFLFLNKNVCCGYSLEAPRQDSSNEYPQHMCFYGELGKTSVLFSWKKVPYLVLWNDVLFILFQTKAERVHEELQLVVDYMSNVIQPLLSSSFVVLPVSTLSIRCWTACPMSYLSCLEVLLFCL